MTTAASEHERTTALAVRSETIEASPLVLTRSPEVVLEEASQAARALKRVLDAKAHPVMLNGERYLEYEDWLTTGRFFNVTVKVIESRWVEFGQVKGFEARAVVIDAMTGRELSAASSMCLDDEPKWRSRPRFEFRNGRRTRVGEESVPLFQLSSMAQTRACAKALRNVFAWVVVLAGYKPTPAEELVETENRGDIVETKPAPASVIDVATGELVANAERPTPPRGFRYIDQCREEGGFYHVEFHGTDAQGGALTYKTKFHKTGEAAMQAFRGGLPVQIESKVFPWLDSVKAWEPELALEPDRPSESADASASRCAKHE